MGEAADRIAALVARMTFPTGVEAVLDAHDRVRVTVPAWVVAVRHAPTPTGDSFAVTGLDGRWSQETLAAAADPAVDDRVLGQFVYDEIVESFVAGVLHEFIEFAGLDGRSFYEAHGVHGEGLLATPRMADRIYSRAAAHPAEPVER